MVSEGQRQLTEAIKFNARNRAKGAASDNWYVIGLSTNENWLEINRGIRPVLKEVSFDQPVVDRSGGLLSAAFLTNINEQLIAVNSNDQDVEMYFIVSEGVKVAIRSQLVIGLEKLENEISTTQAALDEIAGFEQVKNNYIDKIVDLLESQDDNLAFDFWSEYSNSVMAKFDAAVQEIYDVVGNKTSKSLIGGAMIPFSIFAQEANEPEFSFGEFYWAQVAPIGNSIFKSECWEKYKKFLVGRKPTGLYSKFLTNPYEMYIQHHINLFEEFIKGNLCREESCNYLLEEGALLSQHPYLKEVYESDLSSPPLLKRVIEDNPCILWTLVEYDWEDPGKSEYVEQLGEIIAAVMYPTLAIPAFPIVLGTILEGWTAEKAVNCTVAAAMDAALQVAFNMAFEEMSLEEAKKNIDPLSVIGSCVEGTLNSEVTRLGLLATSGAVQCLVNGVDFDESGNSSIDEEELNVEPIEFQTEDCIKGAVIAILIQGALSSRQAQILKNATLFRLAKGLSKIGALDNQVYKIMKVLGRNITSSADIQKLLGVSDEVAQQLFSKVNNDPDYLKLLFEDGMFMRILDWDAVAKTKFLDDILENKNLLVSFGGNRSLVDSWNDLAKIGKIVDGVPQGHALRADTDFLERYSKLDPTKKVKLRDYLDKQKAFSGRKGQVNYVESKYIDGVGDVTIRYDQYGFPDFTDYCPRPTNKYILYADDLKGTSADFRRANQKLAKEYGFEKPYPKGSDNKYLELESGDFRWTPGNQNFYKKVNGEWIKHTWHHHQDGKTIFPLDSRIHNTSEPGSSGFPHSGGDALIKEDLKEIFESPIFN